ncbi:hypothetical protein UACE39S_04247 [Ureibacillus acetophenoni]
MIDETGVGDTVMIGRAALGDPWMIYRTVQYLETGELKNQNQLYVRKWMYAGCILND